MLKRIYIIFFVLLCAISSATSAPMAPKTASKQTKSTRATIIDGQEFISVRELGKHLGGSIESAGPMAVIVLRAGTLTIVEGSLCIGLGTGESVRVAQLNHPAVLIGQELYVPKRSTLDAIAGIKNFTELESEMPDRTTVEHAGSEPNGNDNNNEFRTESNHSYEKSDYYTPAVKDIDLSAPEGTVAPAAEKGIIAIEERATRSREELDKLIQEVGKIKSYDEEKEFDPNAEKIIDLEQTRSQSDIDRIIDRSEPNNSHDESDVQSRSHVIAPKVDEVKDLFQRGIRAIGNLKLNTPEIEEPHTSESNPKLIEEEGKNDELPTPVPPKKKIEDKPQPPNVYKLPTNLIRKRVKK